MRHSSALSARSSACLRVPPPVCAFLCLSAPFLRLNAI